MYLGIDLGTSAVKTCVLQPDGQVAASHSAPIRTDHPFEGASEQACKDWWTATVQAVCALAPELRSQVRAIGLSGQMHGAVLLDPDLQPIRPAILWNDARASLECDDILGTVPDAATITGAVPMPGLAAPKLLWLSRHEPDTHARIAHILLPKDYIGLRLHGGLVTDPSDAAGTSWFDQAAGVWSDLLCEATATDPAWLPTVRHGAETAGVLGRTASETLGLPLGIPVATGAGDAAAGAVGVGAVSVGDGFISLGTSAQLFVSTDHYRPNPQSRIHSYAHTVPDMWFQMAAMLNGARPIAWLASLLGRPIADLLTEAEAARPGPLFLPYLTGERTPHGDSDIRGGFGGLSETTTHGSLMRAVVEAVSFTFADAVRVFEATGTSPRDVLAIGGGTRSDFVLQTIANATGCRIGRADGGDIAPAVGAARLAMATADGEQGKAIFAKPGIGRWFDPTEEGQDDLQARLQAFRALYPALKSVQQKVGPSP
ncbi:MAG: xylulokinase [Pseudomonadota bacterium]